MKTKLNQHGETIKLNLHGVNNLNKPMHLHGVINKKTREINLKKVEEEAVEVEVEVEEEEENSEVEEVEEEEEAEEEEVMKTKGTQVITTTKERVNQKTQEVGELKIKRIKTHNNKVDGELRILEQLQKVVGANNPVGEIKLLKNKKKGK